MIPVPELIPEATVMIGDEAFSFACGPGLISFIQQAAEMMDAGKIDNQEFIIQFLRIAGNKYHSDINWRKLVEEADGATVADLCMAQETCLTVMERHALEQLAAAGRNYAQRLNG